ncbi:hypothetical protein RRG08_019647 [Elysia crispata]|uniref:Uncharacterized protein n=1 Tax=Elysia crispata TaxID=231223 RepID=A0AAE1B110_9GAST|nr:hypothetical protein RRG08_019647 [Elysia crispata]
MSKAKEMPDFLELISSPPGAQRLMTITLKLRVEQASQTSFTVSYCQPLTNMTVFNGQLVKRVEIKGDYERETRGEESVKIIVCVSEKVKAD